MARKRYLDAWLRRAGIFPGDRALVIEGRDGRLANSLARTFTKAVIVMTDAAADEVARAREHARGDGVAGRVAFVRARADALPFRTEVFDATTIGPETPWEASRAATLAEAHRVTAWGAKVYATSYGLERAPVDVPLWDFDGADGVAARQLGFVKVQVQRVALLAGGGRLGLVQMRREGDAVATDEEE